MLFNGDKLYMFSSVTPSQCMGFIMAGDGVVIGVDSATAGEAENIEKTVLACGGVVNRWLFTHAHHDHIQGFSEIMRRGNIRVESVSFAFPSYEYIMRVENNDELQKTVYNDFFEAIEKHNIRVVASEKGVEMKVGQFRITPLSDGSAVGERLNSSSVVYRVDTRGDSVLFLGDMDWVAEDKILEEFPDKIKCPVVQVAHHGQHGVTEKFYQAVQPKVALWCTPEWLWNNDIGTGFNKGPFATLETREWLRKLGTVNYRFTNEITVLE